MNCDYHINYLKDSKLSFFDIFSPETIPANWKSVDEANLGLNNAQEGDNTQAKARVCWNENGIHVLMYANDSQLKKDIKDIGGDVYTDSCLEFFLRPDPNQKKYANFEINPEAVMHIGLGTGRYNRKIYNYIPQGFNPSHSELTGKWWAVNYTIPTDFIKEHFGVILKKGMIIRGNFYHLGYFNGKRNRNMFKQYQIEKMDFHMPDLFAWFSLD